MLSQKLILSLGVVATFSASTSALAFQNFSSSPVESPQSVIYVNVETLEDGAHKFISDLAKQGIGVLESNDISEDERKKEFRDFLRNRFDMKTIGRFALGRYWKTSSKTEQKEYLELFEDMVVEVYSRRFSEYNGQKIDVVSSRQQGKSDAIVSSVIIPESGPEIDVQWRVRKKKSGQYKVIDIIVEGVSMSLTQRSDFASVIQRGGGKVDILLAHLRPED